MIADRRKPQPLRKARKPTTAGSTIGTRDLTSVKIPIKSTAPTPVKMPAHSKKSPPLISVLMSTNYAPIIAERRKPHPLRKAKKPTTAGSTIGTRDLTSVKIPKSMTEVTAVNMNTPP